jgi:hypothetical protein
MKHCLLAALAAFTSLAAFAADVGVSISVGEPGFYGRIDIGDLPHPTLVFRQPLIIKPVVGVVHAPIYLHVPPGHANDWAKHCSKYNACGERVFFVHDQWYNEVYVPQYQKRHGKHEGSHSDKEHGHGKDKD